MNVDQVNEWLADVQESDPVVVHIDPRMDDIAAGLVLFSSQTEKLRDLVAAFLPDRAFQTIQSLDTWIEDIASDIVAAGSSAG